MDITAARMVPTGTITMDLAALTARTAGNGMNTTVNATKTVKMAGSGTGIITAALMATTTKCEVPARIEPPQSRHDLTNAIHEHYL
jgi:phospholipid N-methyltransferase